MWNGRNSGNFMKNWDAFFGVSSVARAGVRPGHHRRRRPDTAARPGSTMSCCETSECCNCMYNCKIHPPCCSLERRSLNRLAASLKSNERESPNTNADDVNAMITR